MKRTPYKGFRSKKAVHAADQLLYELEKKRAELLKLPKTPEAVRELEDIQNQQLEAIGKIMGRRILKAPVAAPPLKPVYVAMPVLSKEDILDVLRSRPDHSWKAGQIAEALQAEGKIPIPGSAYARDKVNKAISRLLRNEAEVDPRQATCVVLCVKKGSAITYTVQQPPTVLESTSPQATKEVPPAAPPLLTPAVAPVPVPVPPQDPMVEMLRKLGEDINSIRSVVSNSWSSINAALLAQERKLVEMVYKAELDKVELLEAVSAEIKKQTEAREEAHFKALQDLISVVSAQHQELLATRGELSTMQELQKKQEEALAALNKHVELQDAALISIREFVGVTQQYAQKTNERVKEMHLKVVGVKP